MRRDIHDFMKVVCRPQESYPESFVSLSLFLAEIYTFVILVKKSDIHTDTHTLQKFNIDLVALNGQLFGGKVEGEVQLVVQVAPVHVESRDLRGYHFISLLWRSD